MRERILTVLVVLLSILGFIVLATPVGAPDVHGRAQAWRALQSSVSLVSVTRDKNGKVTGESSGCAGVIAATRMVLTAFHCIRTLEDRVLVRPYADQKRLLKVMVKWTRVGYDLAVLETAEIVG